MMPDEYSCKIKLTDDYYNKLKRMAYEMDINVKKLVNTAINCANKDIEKSSYLRRLDTICQDKNIKNRSFKINKEYYEDLLKNLKGTDYSIKEIIRDVILYYPSKIFDKYQDDMNN